MTQLYDFNLLEKKAKEFVSKADFDKALRIYFFMADGDPSLDGGYLGTKIGECYEAQGILYAAKYWHGRAVEENPEVRVSSKQAVERLEKIVDIAVLLED